MPAPRPRPEPASWLDDVDVQVVQPYQATKTYHCPGCNRPVRPGIGHVVAVPREAPDLRRHWHRACWAGHQRRRSLSS